MSDDARLNRLRDLMNQRDRLVREYQGYPEGSGAREIVYRSIERIDRELEQQVGPSGSAAETVDRLERNSAIEQGLGGAGCGFVLALIGAGWSLWSYYSAGPGETYTILWGLIGFGVLLFVGGVLRIVAARR